MESYKDKYNKYKMKYLKLKGGTTTSVGRIIKDVPHRMDIYTVIREEGNNLITNFPGRIFDKNLENVTWKFLNAQIGMKVDLFDRHNPEIVIETGIIISEGEIDDVAVWRLDTGSAIYKCEENEPGEWRINTNNPVQL